jgi:SAM-dependent methyltransferase
MSDWNDPAVAEYYEAFCRRHSRYIDANAALVSHAAIEPGMRILDLGAGTGRTAEAVLPLLGSTGRVVCVEPAEAMRSCGMRRITDPRIEWRADLSESPPAFDRVLSGATVWQLAPLDEWIRKLTALLLPGGALCFNMPALYLCEPDDPGGGRDPLLLELPAVLSEPKDFPGEQAAAEGVRMTRRKLSAILRRALLRSRSWRFRYRLTQAAYADWLKIPVLTQRLLPGVDPAERARRIDRAFAAVDRDSWKWERWRGWTSWKQ